MATNRDLMNRVVQIALAEVGEKEFPANTNNVKYNTWFYGKPVANTRTAQYPWCGTFVSWCFDQAKAGLGTIDYSRGFAGCPYALRFFRGQLPGHPENMVLKGYLDAKPGDIVIFDWQNDGKPDHTGIFYRHNGDAKTFSCIEGNTSIPTAGMTPEQIAKANSNGGEVILRTDRKYSQAVFIHPNVYDK